MKYKNKILILIFIIVSLGVVYAGVYGDITSLSTNKESYTPGENIRISSTVEANVDLNTRSVLRYVITDSDGNTVRTRNVTINSRLDEGETYDNTWSFSNNLAPGEYNIQLNWYARNGTLIDSRSTSFTSTKKGIITELVAVGSPYSDLGNIQFRCVTTNKGTTAISANWCNLTIRYGPNNQYVNSVRYRVPRLTGGQSYTYLWNTSNVDFPYNSFQTGGSYEITATWTYSGGSDTKTTSFYSVPSPWIMVSIVGILIGLSAVFFRNRLK